MSRTINYYNVSADPSQVTAPEVESADDDEIDDESGMFPNVSLMYVSTVIFTTGIIFFIMATFVKQITRRKSMLVLAGQIFASLSFGVLITNFLEVGGDEQRVKATNITCKRWCWKGKNRHKRKIGYTCSRPACQACGFCKKWNSIHGKEEEEPEEEEKEEQPKGPTAEEQAAAEKVRKMKRECFNTKMKYWREYKKKRSWCDSDIGDGWFRSQDTRKKQAGCNELPHMNFHDFGKPGRCRVHGSNNNYWCAWYQARVPKGKYHCDWGAIEAYGDGGNPF